VKVCPGALVTYSLQAVASLLSFAYGQSIPYWVSIVRPRKPQGFTALGFFALRRHKTDSWMLTQVLGFWMYQNYNILPK